MDASTPSPASTSLYVAALRLYGGLLDSDPPEGCSDEWWDSLLAASGNLYLLAALRPRGQGSAARLHDLARATRECLDLLEEVDLKLPLVQRAWVCLRVVVEELEAEMCTLPIAAGRN